MLLLVSVLPPSSCSQVKVRADLSNGPLQRICQRFRAASRVHGVMLALAHDLLGYRLRMGQWMSRILDSIK